MIKALHAVRNLWQQQAALLYIHWDQKASEYFDIDFLSCHLSQQNKASAAPPLRRVAGSKSINRPLLYASE